LVFKLTTILSQSERYRFGTPRDLLSADHGRSKESRGLHHVDKAILPLGPQVIPKSKVYILCLVKFVHNPLRKFHLST
jgi:hypothetical protein